MQLGDAVIQPFLGVLIFNQPPQLTCSVLIFLISLIFLIFLSSSMCSVLFHYSMVRSQGIELGPVAKMYNIG